MRDFELNHLVLKNDLVWPHQVSEKAQAVNCTVINHYELLKTGRKCRKHEPQAIFFYISRMFGRF